MSKVLYWISGSVPCWRVAAVLTEKKLQYESKRCTTTPESMKSPEVMAINPRGQMPSFKDGDVAVNESLAAMQYLDDMYMEIPLMPSDAAARGLALQRFHEASGLYGSIQPLFYKKMTGQVNTETEQEEFNKGIEKCKKDLAFFESYLSADPQYIAGDAFTLADINLALACMFAMRAGATFSEYPHLLKYCDAMKERGCIKETWPPHWTDSANKDWLTAL